MAANYDRTCVSQTQSSENANGDSELDTNNSTDGGLDMAVEEYTANNFPIYNLDGPDCCGCTTEPMDVNTPSFDIQVKSELPDQDKPNGTSGQGITESLELVPSVSNVPSSVSDTVIKTEPVDQVRDYLSYDVPIQSQISPVQQVEPMPGPSTSPDFQIKTNPSGMEGEQAARSKLLTVLFVAPEPITMVNPLHPIPSSTVPTPLVKTKHIPTSVPIGSKESTSFTRRNKPMTDYLPQKNKKVPGIWQGYPIKKKPVSRQSLQNKKMLDPFPRPTKHHQKMQCPSREQTTLDDSKKASEIDSEPEITDTTSPGDVASLQPAKNQPAASSVNSSLHAQHSHVTNTEYTRTIYPLSKKACGLDLVSTDKQADHLEVDNESQVVEMYEQAETDLDAQDCDSGTAEPMDIITPSIDIQVKSELPDQEEQNGKSGQCVPESLRVVQSVSDMPPPFSDPSEEEQFVVDNESQVFEVYKEAETEIMLDPLSKPPEESSSVHDLSTRHSRQEQPISEKTDLLQVYPIAVHPNPQPSLSKSSGAGIVLPNRSTNVNEELLYYYDHTYFAKNLSVSKREKTRQAYSSFSALRHSTPLLKDRATFCSLCSKQFSSGKDLHLHQKTGHIIKCYECKERFDTWDSFLLHEPSHSRKHSKYTLGAISMDYPAVVFPKHLKGAGGKGGSVCKHCDTGIYTSNDFRMHNIHHELCKTVVESEMAPVDPNFELLMMLDSGAYVSNLLEGLDHGQPIGEGTFSFTTENAPSFIPATSPYTCKICHKSFKDDQNLKKHFDSKHALKVNTLHITPTSPTDSDIASEPSIPDDPNDGNDVNCAWSDEESDVRPESNEPKVLSTDEMIGEIVPEEIVDDASEEKVGGNRQKDIDQERNIVQKVSLLENPNLQQPQTTSAEINQFVLQKRGPTINQKELTLEDRVNNKLLREKRMPVKHDHMYFQHKRPRRLKKLNKREEVKACIAPVQMEDVSRTVVDSEAAPYDSRFELLMVLDSVSNIFKVTDQGPTIDGRESHFTSDKTHSSNIKYKQFTCFHCFESFGNRRKLRRHYALKHELTESNGEQNTEQLSENGVTYKDSKKCSELHSESGKTSKTLVGADTSVHRTEEGPSLVSPAHCTSQMAISSQTQLSPNSTDTKCTKADGACSLELISPDCTDVENSVIENESEVFEVYENQHNDGLNGETIYFLPDKTCSLEQVSNDQKSETKCSQETQLKQINKSPRGNITCDEDLKIISDESCSLEQESADPTELVNLVGSEQHDVAKSETKCTQVMLMEQNNDATRVESSSDRDCVILEDDEYVNVFVATEYSASSLGGGIEENETGWCCDICAKVFPDLGSLEDHKTDTHQKPIICRTCSEVFFFPEALERHSCIRRPHSSVVYTQRFIKTKTVRTQQLQPSCVIILNETPAINEKKSNSKLSGVVEPEKRCEIQRENMRVLQTLQQHTKVCKYYPVPVSKSQTSYNSCIQPRSMLKPQYVDGVLIGFREETVRVPKGVEVRHPAPRYKQGSVLPKADHRGKLKHIGPSVDPSRCLEDLSSISPLYVDGELIGYTSVPKDQKDKPGDIHHSVPCVSNEKKKNHVINQSSVLGSTPRSIDPESPRSTQSSVLPQAQGISVDSSIVHDALRSIIQPIYYKGELMGYEY